ncbi:hypothetical protein BH10ACT8_BH10ACT8_29070 [soil metagenome]|jgi:DNA-binding NarL/FixJ family response regulator
MSTAMSISVIVADDDALVRDALCATFHADDRFTVVATATNGLDAVELVRQHRPDVVLLDVRMPGGGVEAARAIRNSDSGTTVVVVSAKIDAHLVADMLRVGARGMFVKGRLGDSLPDLVARCRAGEVLLATPAAAEGLRMYALPGS